MIKSRTNRVAAVASGVMIAAGALLAASPPAQASPGACNYSVGSFSVTLRCTVGTGQYRVVVQCTDELRGTMGTYYGGWVGIGGASTGTCPYQGGVQWQVYNYWREVR